MPISTEVEESDKQRRRAAWVPGEASPTTTATTVEASSAWAVAYCSASYAIPIFMLLRLETGKSMPQRCGEWMGVFHSVGEASWGSGEDELARDDEADYVIASDPLYPVVDA
jgi:hypothetical protein